MATYRIYRLDAADFVSGPPIIVYAGTDREAVELAGRYLDAYCVEVWQSARLVTRLYSGDTNHLDNAEWPNGQAARAFEQSIDALVASFDLRDRIAIRIATHHPVSRQPPSSVTRLTPRPVGSRGKHYKAEVYLFRERRALSGSKQVTDDESVRPNSETHRI
jgi:hypothetical protein